jgi:hypothetical protein|tara:strand:+ start:157 stop:354 length:198 start_codon:yes stop_codon:yes gene_type:complete
MMAVAKGSLVAAHSRIDELLLEVRQHAVFCSSEAQQQNARLRRLEAILIASAGATILMLLSLVLK